MVTASQNDSVNNHKYVILLSGYTPSNKEITPQVRILIVHAKL